MIETTIYFLVVIGYITTAIIIAMSWLQEARRKWNPDIGRWNLVGLCVVVACWRIVLFVALTTEKRHDNRDTLFGISRNTSQIVMAGLDFLILTFLLLTLYSIVTHMGPSRTHLVSQLNLSEQKYQELEEDGLNALKDHLLSVAAHELKTPLTVLKGHTQILKKKLTKLGLQEETEESMNLILVEISQLEQVINQLLQVDRAQMGQLVIERTSFDMRNLVSETTDRMTIAHHSGNRIHTTIPVSPVFGLWDVSRIESVLLNLIDNALKYSTGVVNVMLVADAVGISIHVQDFGSGITREDQARMFDAFYRSSRTREQASGLGIGLAISRAFVHLHDGLLLVESEIGVGTTMTVRLPYI